MHGPIIYCYYTGMSKARMMGAGAGGTQYGVLTSCNQGGGNKKQGLVTTTNTPSPLDAHVRVRGGGHNRNWIFCMNQLGGVGRRRGQASGPGNRGGISASCQALAWRRRQQYPPKPCGARVRGWGAGVKFADLCKPAPGDQAPGLAFSGFVYAPPAASHGEWCVPSAKPPKAGFHNITAVTPITPNVPDTCWRDARSAYNKSSKWPLTIGYWGGSGSAGPQQFSDIPAEWDIVILAFMIFEEGGVGGAPPARGWVIDAATASRAPHTPGLVIAQYYEAAVDLKNQIDTWRGSPPHPNKFVLASLGGASDSEPGAINPAKSLASWRTIAHRYGLDGIDIDMEGVTMGAPPAAYKQFITEVATNGWIVSLVPQFSNTIIGSMRTPYVTSASAGFLPPCSCGKAASDAYPVNTWCGAATATYSASGQDPYNFFIDSDILPHVDIISLQVYNNFLQVDLFRALITGWLAAFGVRCVGKNTYPACSSYVGCSDSGEEACLPGPPGGSSSPICAAVDPSSTQAPSTCSQAGSSEAEYPELDQRQVSAWDNAHPAPPGALGDAAPGLTPKMIRQKFYIGLCANDCQGPTGHADDPPLTPGGRWIYNNKDICELLPYFRGLMFWAIDTSGNLVSKGSGQTSSDADACRTSAQYVFGDVLSAPACHNPS